MAFRTLDNPPGPMLAAVAGWLLKVRDVVNGIMRGKINATLEVTLTANAGSTAVSSPLLSGASGIYLCPLSANAAAALATTHVASQGAQSLTLAHASNAQTDRNFRLLIIG